jgi:hypothetical protein
MADTSGPSPWIVDVLALNLNDLDVKQLPALSCSAANAAYLQGSLTISGGGSGNTLTVTGNASVTGDLGVTKNLTIGGTLHANGDIDSATGVVIVRSPLYVPQGIISDGWRVTALTLSGGTNGVLPKTAKFESHEGTTLLILAAGSGWGSAAATIGMDVQIDGKSCGELKRYTNENGSHKAFNANPLVVTTVKPGSHTVTLAALAGTSTDLNDYFSVTILELPFIQNS